LAKKEETLKTLAQRLKLETDEVKIRKELSDLTAEELKKLEVLAATHDKLLGYIKQAISEQQTALEQLNEQIKLLDQIIQRKDKIYSQQVASELKQEAEIERQKKLVGLSEEGAEQDAKKSNNFVDGLLKIDKAGSKLGKNDMLSLFMGGISKRVVARLGLASLIGEAFRLAVSIHDAGAAFRKTTGASDHFAKSIDTVYEKTRRYGITAAELGQVHATLYTTFTDYTFATTRQRDALLETGAALAGLGIAEQDFAKGIQFQVKAFGLSSAAARQNALDLTAFAEAIGVTPKQMAQDFISAGNAMAKMGNQGYEAFKDLEIASKKSGFEVEKILRLTDKFDTFEGAATMAGKLNAQLGGNFVNAMELMMATDPAERFKIIQDGLRGAGLSWESMEYFQKIALAGALELENVSDLALILSGDHHLLAESTKDSTKSIREAKEQTRDYASFQKQLHALFMAAIPIITPLVSAFTSLFKLISENDVVMSVFSGLVIGMAAALFAAMLPISGTAVAIAGLITGIVTLISWWFGKDVGASTFYEGIGKTAHSFSDLALGILETLNPFNQIIKLIETLGATFKSIIGSVVELFTALTAPEAASNIMKIGEAITAIPMRKNIEFAASMTAAASAATASALLHSATFRGGKEEALKRETAAAPAGRVTERLLQPVSIELKGDKLADFVVEVIGQNVSARIKPYA